MSDQHWFNVTAALIALIVVVGGAVAIGWEGEAVRPGATPPPAAPPAAYLYLTISFNPANGLDEYFPANFSVPAHIPVEVVISNYDNGSNSPPAEFAVVAGTLGGTADLQGRSGPTPYASLPTSDIAHTFTLLGNGYDLNVPIAPSRGSGGPTVVAFSAYFNETGTFVWHCYAPCDMMAMTDPGFMQGTVTVLAS